MKKKSNIIKNSENEPHLSSYRAVAGLDWADSKHDICLLDLVKGESEQLIVKHNVEDLTAFINRLRSQFDINEGGKIAVVIEQKRGGMINFLLGLDFVEIFPINPKNLSNFRKAIYPSGRKNDIVDSALAVEYFVKHGHHLGSPWKPDIPEMREIGFLTEHRRDLVDARTKCVQKLIDALKQYYPLALELFEDMGSELACQFLKRWPNFEVLTRVRESTLRKFFYAQNSRSAEKIEKRIKTIEEAKRLTGDQAAINALSLRVEVQVAEILVKIPRIKRYDKRIAELFCKQKDAYIFESLPGAGAVLEPRLITVFGSDRERYQDASNITEYTGVAPVTRESGESKKTGRRTRKVLFRFGAPRFLRQTMVEFAGCSVRYCAWAKAYYSLKQQQGQSRHTILRGLAIKWIRIIHRCLLNDEPYDDEKYLESLKSKGSPIWLRNHEMETTA